MGDLEIRVIEIPSPIDELNIGDDFFYKGYSISGISKIKRFYKDVVFLDNVEQKPIKNSGKGHPVIMELENGYLALLGFISYCEEFELNNSFKLGKYGYKTNSYNI